MLEDMRLRKLSPETQSANGFTAAAPFLYTTTLEMPRSKSYFP